MKEVNVENIRNIGLVGHSGTGKTSLAESLLFVGGAINRMGAVDEGHTTTDYTEEETERKHSISLSLGHLDWKDHKINLIDMPGVPDFVGEVECGLRVADLLVCLLNATGGVEVGAEQVLQRLDEDDTPRVFFINKLEKENASFTKTVDQLTDRYGVKAVPLQLPIGEGIEFTGLVDLISMKGFTWDDSGKVSPTEIPADLKAKAEEARAKLMENAAEADDTLLEKFFESGELSDEELKKGVRAGVISGKFFPILGGAATAAAGSRLLLDFIEDYGPSPLDRPPVEGNKPGSDEKLTRKTSTGEPMSALVFKTVSEPHVGELSLIRVFSGRLRHGDDALNSSRGQHERLGQLYVLNGKNRKEVSDLVAGDIGAAVKLKNTHTGDTLCDAKDPIVFPPIRFPNPILDMAIKAASKGDEEKVGQALSRFHEEDPSFSHKVMADIRQTIIEGQGELQFDVIVSKLKKRYGVDVTLEKPRIPYRETITGKTEIEYKYKKQSGGRGQYGHVHLRLEPLQRGGGFEFADEITGGVIPSKFIPSVEKGIVEAMNEGALSGHPVVDVKAALFYGSYHTVDSSDMAFKVAGSMAFKEGFMKCNPVLLEPIYQVNILVPDEFTGDVMGDLSSRRGKILGMDPMGKWQQIRAHVPLAELYKYSTTLRSLTQGRGTYTREFSHYDPVPREIAPKVVEEAIAAKKAAEE
ncbi:MAG: elongation factor G [Candidatus Zixiibacteriota bacterium]